MKPRVKSQNTRREREKSCHHGSGRARRENSIVIFRFSEVSKVDRCAGYGFLLVSDRATQEGWHPLQRLRRHRDRPGFLSFQGERGGLLGRAPLISPCNACCLTLIFLSLLLVIPPLSFSAAPRSTQLPRNINVGLVLTRTSLNENEKFSQSFWNEKKKNDKTSI